MTLSHCYHEDRWDDIRAALRRIEAQVTATNGRVTRLERCLLLVAGVLIGASLVLGARAERASSLASAALRAVGEAAAGALQ